MVESCCAFNCTNKRTKGVKMKFHRIPKDPNLRKIWLMAIGRVDFTASETTVICEKHFNLADYEVNVYGNKVLKKTAVPNPSLFDFPPAHHKKEVETRRFLKRKLDDLGLASETIQENEVLEDGTSEAGPSTSTLLVKRPKPDSPLEDETSEAGPSPLPVNKRPKPDTPKPDSPKKVFRREPVLFEDFKFSDLNNIQRRHRFWKVTHESITKYKKVNKYNQRKIRRQSLKIKHLNNLLDELLKQQKISPNQSFVLKNLNAMDQSTTETEVKEKSSYDLYLQEIEGIDDYWGPTFRTIFDNHEHLDFKRKLEERIKHHDKDIERLCNVYYQGFIESVTELLEVRSQSKNLNKQVVGVDKQLQKAFQALSKSGSELLQSRKVQSNIAVVIAQMNLCLPVFVSYSKLQKQISEKRYYPALKTLEELERIHLPHVANYRFSNQLRQKIPKYRDKIEAASMMDLKDFLENIRKFSPKIGEVAMRHTSEQLASDPTVVGRKKKRNFLNSEPRSNYSEEDLSAQELIDFSPIYRGMHIAEVLGKVTTFEVYYRSERTKQARLVLQPPTNMHESEESYRNYIYAVLGFFILEDHVLNTGRGLITKVFLEEMWSVALSKITTALQTHSAYCTDATLVLKIKDLIMLFCTTLRNYGYSVKPLWELVRELRDHYTEVLMQRWVQVFREILSKEDFQPIVVQGEDEYEQILQSFPWDVDLPDDIQFPYSFPFSSMVPKVYQQVKEFIYACLKFSEDLNLSQVEVDEMIRKSMNLLLTRTFSGCLSSSFRSPHINLQKITQIIIDTGYLEDANIYLDQFISNVTGEESRNITSEHAMFRVAREDAVRQICEKLKQKLDEFLELESYDWNLVEPKGHASSFISDIIAFLQTTFHSFTDLPPEVAQVACRAACDHIANSMFTMLLSDDIKQISMGALNQLNLDLLQCELFAASEPVKGLQQDELLKYFAKLREILDLLISWDWPTYFHDYAQDTSRYKNVRPEIAIILLEKLKEGDKKNIFTVLNKNERDKKKLLETVLKQLKQLSVK